MEGRQEVIDSLIKPKVTCELYSEQLRSLGYLLGNQIGHEMPMNKGKVMLACMAEDGDGLANGMIESLGSLEVLMSIFWLENVEMPSETEKQYNFIKTSYVEPIEQCETLIVAKTIIDDSCELTTLLMRCISIFEPQNICIASVVMSETAKEEIQRTFAKEITEKMRFVSFREV